MHLGLVLARQAERHPDKEAVVFEGMRLTYGQFNERVNRLANVLTRLGVEKGDRVAVLLYNCNQYLESFWALAKLGAVLVPVNWRLAGREVKYVLDDSDSKVLIYGDAYSATVGTIRSDLETVRSFILVGEDDESGSLLYEDLLNAAETTEPVVDVDMEELFIIMYTSGTTGLPKGTMLTHSNILWTSLNQIVDLEVVPEDRTLVVAPLFHVGGLLIFTVSAIHTASAAIILRQFDVENVLRTIETERITTMFGAPTMFHMIVQHPELVSKYKHNAVRLMLSGGASLPLPTMQAMIKLFPDVKFTEGYGITEGSSCSSVLRPEWVIKKSGSIGKPFLHNEWRIVDDAGRDVSVGEIGEIVLRGPTVIKGYWNKPETTAEAIVNGWFHTGDLARMDDDGFVYIVDRKKDMIISGAENIYPKEIENVLYENPKILEAAVIGVPDPKWGESVMAVIALKPGVEMTEQEVIDFCKERLASYKKPKYVRFVPELPKNPSGKIVKPVLREKFGRIG